MLDMAEEQDSLSVLIIGNLLLPLLRILRPKSGALGLGLDMLVCLALIDNSLGTSERALRL